MFMKKSLLIFFFLTAIIPLLFADQPPSPLTLWYNQPASQWEEALPIGNGHMGAMIFGGTDKERLQLNEETI